MAGDFLQLNTDKTEVMIIAPDNITHKIRQVIRGLSSFDCSDIRNLGVIFNRSLYFNSHASLMFFSISGTSLRVGLWFKKKEMEMLVHAFISSWLDYCNVLYATSLFEI